MIEGLIGKSSAMQRVREKVMRAAPTEATVLIRGETGTGKELVAKAIQYNGVRKHKPFIPINCTAIPEGLLESELFGHMKGAFAGAYTRRRGLFEEANEGTLFLDEIGDMGLGLQVKLLRVLETKEIRPVGSSETRKVDVRIIAATDRDLEQAVAEHQFREGLYYRLKVVTITLPPLRERREDIPLLVEHFVKLFNEEHGKEIRGVDPCVIEVFMGYNWPGNVRELRNTLERMAVMGQEEVLDPRRISLGVARLLEHPVNARVGAADADPGVDDDDIAKEMRKGMHGLLTPEGARIIAEHLRRNGSIAPRQYSQLLGVSLSTASRHLGELSRAGVLTAIGRGAVTCYVLARTLGDER